MVNVEVRLTKAPYISNRNEFHLLFNQTNQTEGTLIYASASRVVDNRGKRDLPAI